MALRWPGMFLLCLLAASAAWAQPIHVVAGRGLAGITLGMSRTDAWKHIGKPTETRSLRLAGRSYAWDNWQDDRRRETVISRQGRAVQVEHRVVYSDYGDHPVDTFLSIRKRHPHLQVRLYDIQEAVGCVLLVDDVGQGVAWTHYIHHRDDPGIHLFNEIGPDMVITHRPGRAALPDAAETLNERDPLTDAARAWFAAKS